MLSKWLLKYLVSNKTKMNKTEIRQSALEKRSALSGAEKRIKDLKIAKLLESQDFFQDAKKILIYYSHHNEVDTLYLMKKWMHEKNLFLPRLTSEDNFVALPLITLEALELNQFGIPEPPKSEHEISPKLDLIIVPGVAFDGKGGRIGMGKGYYDRFLAGKREVPKVALAYSAQVLDTVPQDPYDESIDMIATEDELIRCHG